MFNNVPDIAAAGASRNESKLTFEQAEPIVTPLFTCPNDEIRRFVIDAFRHCILGKISSPEPPFEHVWMTPGGPYRGQWLWDTMFVADLLAIVPGQRDNLRGIFRNYWEFQPRWNARRPQFMHDLIPCMIMPGNDHWLEFPAYSQIPILAWGLERVFSRTKDIALVRESIAPLERFHEWYWRERDVTGVGLCAVGAYSGDIQHARFETFDLECNLDGLQLTPHPRRPHGTDNGDWYGDILLPGITSYLIKAEQSLARLARMVGDEAMAQRRESRATKSIDAMRNYMWSSDAGTFLAVRRDSLDQINLPTIGSWISLWSGVATKEQAARMVDVLKSRDWATPLPIPTVGRYSAKFNSPLKPGEVPHIFWRGDVWPAPNYQVAAGLASYGYRDLAAHIASTSIRNAIKHGINERYHPDDGRTLGAANIGMSCTLVTMMLDGLTGELALRTR